MLTRDLLLALREGRSVPPEAVQAFAAQLGTSDISDAQAGAFAMAICLQGLSEQGRVALTLGMRDSGKVLDWNLPGKVIDKHSTGGVGDSVSLILAPMLAAAGAYVPMISGRGLGHTGGTLDKLEAIPGLKTQLSEVEFRAIVAEVGCAIVAPSPDIAPADQRLYAVRDVTGTVRSRDLITASILAKKLAAGLEGLVLDVKTGSGAVMSDLGQARELAQALVATANGAGCPTSAVLTDMSQPLIPSIGNALEIADVMRAFETGQGAMVEVALELGTQLLKQAQVFFTETGARDGLRATLQDGSAKARFGAMVRAQGGPENFADRWQDYLEIAPAYELRAGGTGYLSQIDGTALGQAVVALGGGRQREDDRIDHSVGLSDIARLGTHLRKGAPIARLHCRNAKQAEVALRAIESALTLRSEPPVLPDLIIERVMPTKAEKHG